MSCIRGYGKYQTNSLCSQCESFAVWNIVRAIGVSIFVLAYLIYNAKTMSMDVNGQLNDVLMKIIINHLQKITIISFIDLSSITDEFNKVFSFINFLSFLTEDVFSNDCFLQSFFNNVDGIYLYKTLIVVVLPFLFSFFCFILYLILNIKMKTSVTNKISVIFFISVFLFYPLITKCSLSLLNCMILDEFGAEFLYSSPNIQCWVGLHFFFFILIGIIGILLWGAGFPIMLYFFIKERILSEKNLLKTLNHSPMEVKKKLMQKNIAYKFFYKDYKFNFFYWESLIFTQKFGLSLFQNIPQIISQEKADLFFIYYSLLIKFHPFKIRQMNILEGFSIISAIISKALYVIGKTYQNNYIIFITLYSFIYFVNFIFFGLAFYFFIKLTQWRKLIKNTAKVVKHYTSKIPLNLFSLSMTKIKKSFAH